MQQLTPEVYKRVKTIQSKTWDYVNNNNRYLHVSHRQDGAELWLRDGAGFSQQALQEYFQSPSWSLQVRGSNSSCTSQKTTKQTTKNKKKHVPNAPNLSPQSRDRKHLVSPSGTDFCISR